MAFKTFRIDDKIDVTIYKRRANRSLRLSIAANGEVRVTIPLWAPYGAGIQFAAAKLDWIQSQRPHSQLIIDNQMVGKAHRLHFVASSNSPKPSSRLKPGEIVITHPASLHPSSVSVQSLALKAAQRALRLESERLLPQRLATLAAENQFNYSSVAVKLLKSRWGSCDQHQRIILNLYLIQLPWHLIDYVLLHELTHTKVLKHGPDFWEALEVVLPDCQARRRELRAYQPVLLSPSGSD